MIITPNQKKKLQLIQNKIIRKALGVPTTTPTCTLHIETGIPPIEAMINQKKLIYLWSLLNKPDRLTNKVAAIQTNYYSYNETWMSKSISTLDKCT